MPPPPGLDDDPRWKGRGKGSGPYGGEESRPGLPDGLVVSKLPAELGSLSVLNRHFRQFGEVLRITVQAEEGRAFVQFADRDAVEAALGVPVLERADLVLQRAPRAGKGKCKGKGKGDKGVFAENRVLCANPEDQRKADDAKQKRESIAAKKAQLLGGLTDQMKTLMGKLTDPTVPEAKRDLFRKLMEQIKGKIDAISAPTFGARGAAATAGEAGAQPREVATPPKGRPRAGGKYTLDFRPRVVRVAILQGWTRDTQREELRKLEVVDDQVSDILWEMGGDGAPSKEFSLVRFKDRKHAEKLMARKADMTFSVEWCDCQTLPPPSSPALAPSQAPAAPARPDSAPLTDATALGAGGEGEEGTAKNLAEALKDAAGPDGEPENEPWAVNLSEDEALAS